MTLIAKVQECASPGRNMGQSPMTISSSFWAMSSELPEHKVIFTLTIQKLKTHSKRTIEYKQTAHKTERIPRQNRDKTQKSRNENCNCQRGMFESEMNDMT